MDHPGHQERTHADEVHRTDSRRQHKPAGDDRRRVGRFARPDRVGNGRARDGEYQRHDAKRHVEADWHVGTEGQYGDEMGGPDANAERHDGGGGVDHAGPSFGVIARTDRPDAGVRSQQAHRAGQGNEPEVVILRDASDDPEHRWSPR
jgi:hypothetical protein